ncbi:MAG: aminoacyl-tRNA hydrolase [Candidatus Gastranaerophilales bacterium]|nr:aminoacyl-tRNA hydrolase [Candidatus Gastranaerophilales bacterium]
MKVIVGLGNPGEKYKNTRHNAGFMTTGELASKYNIDGKLNSKFDSIVGKSTIANSEVLIVQPMTFMNLSGNAVVKVLNWYNIEPDELLVVFDDVNLDLGKIRFRPSGADGGHNGVKSIIENLGGFKDFPRLKVGIGPKPGFMPLETYVLQEFSKPEKEILDKVIPVCIEGIEEYLKEGMIEVRNRFNGINLAPEAEQ